MQGKFSGCFIISVPDLGPIDHDGFEGVPTCMVSPHPRPHIWLNCLLSLNHLCWVCQLNSQAVLSRRVNKQSFTRVNALTHPACLFDCVPSASQMSIYLFALGFPQFFTGPKCVQLKRRPNSGFGCMVVPFALLRTPPLPCCAILRWISPILPV